MKITTVTIRNFKGIEKLDIELNGKNVFVMGGNGAGKTSFLDAIWTTLTGKNLPTKVTKEGAKKGFVEVDLGDYIARLKFVKDKTPTFELEQKNVEVDPDTGNPVSDKMIKAPRTFLNDAIKIIDFDVNVFLNLTGNEKVKYLSKIIGIDFTEINGQLEEAFEQRRLDNLKLKTLKAQSNYYDKALAELEPVDVVALSKQIATETGKRNDRTRVSEGIDTRIVEKNKLLERVRTLEAEIMDGQLWLDDSSNAVIADEVFAKMGSDLDSANETNTKINEAREFKRIEGEVTTLENVVEALNTSIDDLKRDKAKLLSGALHVENLDYDIDNESFTWKGLPFEKTQINTADQIIAGLQIGSTLLGDLRILKFDGSLIDRENFELIKAFAEREKIELFVEVVDRENSALQIVTE